MTNVVVDGSLEETKETDAGAWGADECWGSSSAGQRRKGGHGVCTAAACGVPCAGAPRDASALQQCSAAAWRAAWPGAVLPVGPEVKAVPSCGRFRVNAVCIVPRNLDRSCMR